MIHRSRAPVTERCSTPADMLALRTTVLAKFRGVGSAEVGPPVRFPTLIVIRKRLLPSCMIVVEYRPQVQDSDRATTVAIFSVKFAAVSFEAAYHRHRVQRAGGAAPPINGPLSLFKIKCAHVRTVRPWSVW